MLKKLIKYLLFFIITLGVGIYLFLNNQKPIYNGTLELNSLQDKVEVYYDDYGIPHIYAQNDLDAMQALGYVHAQDRLWQMEVVRRIAAGRLSEIFGKKLLKVDKFYLNLGIAKNSKETVAQLDKTTQAYKLSEAYLKGVNNFVKNGKTPLEFTLIGVEKSPFSFEDIYNVFGYMGYGFAMGNQTDPLMSAIKEKLGDEYLSNLDMTIDKNTTLIPTQMANHINEDEVVEFTQVVKQVFNKTPIQPFIGSNSWVLGPKKTKNAKVIFANDPHIGFSQPAVWYQAHITTPTTEIYGFYLALNPFPLLGHNHEYAYGLTMFENDDIDLYVEQNNPKNPNEYLYEGKYKKYDIRTENIQIKDTASVTHTIKESIHGPVINSVVPQVKTKNPVSMYWVYTHRPNTLLEATYNISRAKNIKQFEKGASLVHAPGLNVMYGDAKGNVAWWASANLYKRANNAPTKLLLDGTKAENDSIIYTPFSENPQAINPNSNYVYSCNNQPDSLISKRYIPGYYIAEDRAKRVVELIANKNDWTLEESLEMASDNTSSVAAELIHIIYNNLKDKTLTKIEKQALERLNKWNATASISSVGTTIYTHFSYEYLNAVLKDEMESGIYNELEKTHFMGRMMVPLIKGKYPIWLDDITTQDKKETNADIQLLAFKKTVKALVNKLGDDPSKWTWGKRHTLEHKHPLGEVALLKPFFNVGPFPINGTNEVLNNQMFFPTGSLDYHVHAGPSTRRVIDFSDIENAKAIIPTGQSGNVMSPHYKDQALLYNKGGFITMLLNKEKIQSFERKLELIP